MEAERMPRGGASGVPMTVVVDVANVMGSRPDGWWKDRAAAATKLVARMPGLVGRTVPVPEGEEIVVEQIVAVVEGAAREIAAPDGVIVVRAPKDGDSAIVSTGERYTDAGARVLVVTADRGLRARLPGGVVVAGPTWMTTLLGR
ncbi:hypothetical protein LQ757_12210 [Agromyces sp. SYSU K20354]|uniref:hypothetical protein n=1 Tax=Agromyces cavernae TaxID=2898659 RepID=UPI001E3B4E88|nr:hypothetical protein [Agromyces cavernae]MCD2443037.1 hypothetical protein [Agromyces cavernae]